ncbi:unnamed protein product [Rotaria magnacalcarata]|uniref:Uncharacterized protein n=1 Tax=Rotaria magnacalcarata TaxID=392030 RepID=A0A816XZI8_9BILA|nr:unnamed protein product [Rotaria magnacalcarata]CAF1659500.1 unnamed protein product [Rotaria magnacalcarata]CAF2014433.1 unnamed protein product [Rotaria magnacalcarata]CAF2080003.1 unnamed protein product [Rotaria magnacalcarata]CAF2152643.1 unnamed protein product [Rotaria magnacalcarata]
MASTRQFSSSSNLVREFILRQSFNGTWILTDDEVKQFTQGKSWTYFTSSISQDKNVITTALVIALLESQHVKQQSLWFMVAVKGRQQLVLLGLTGNNIDLLINEIKSKL